MFVEDLQLDSQKYYFVCAAGIGDTMIVCGFHKALEAKYQSSIVIVVPENQAFIPQMFGIKNYQVVDLGVKGIDDLLAKYTSISDKTPIPQKGCLYLAHPVFHTELNAFFVPIYFRKSHILFLDWYKQFLHLPQNTPFEDFKTPPKLSNTAKEILNHLAPLNKIVLISPEATSTEAIPQKFWNSKVQELNTKGYTVICNVKDKGKTICGSIYVPLTLKDMVALAYMCQGVYSVRSGFCDLCYQLDDKLNVYYANRDELYLYGLNSMFNKNINEYVEYNLPEKLIRGKSVIYHKKYLFFSFIPLLTVKEKSGKCICRFLGIPVLSIKKTPNKTRIRLFGIPILKIK